MTCIVHFGKINAWQFCHITLLFQKDSIMAYCTTNFKTKKAFKEAVKNGEVLGVWQPSPMGSSNVFGATVCVEGPQYPAPHSWYATVSVDMEGKVLSVK
ncbi:MAG: hypothetical protein JW384_02562 [Nitrosomonadaceae bacterium]|nr:hypothetical protein [Nitrosomonadaceae bacterium]